MSLRYRIFLPAILSSLALLAACGGGGSSNPPVKPPPSGGFSNSNLSGSYVFSVTGTASTNDFLTIMGVFTADGTGKITGGLLDQNGTMSNGLILTTITSGTYNVGSDGRATGNSSFPTGLLTLQTANGTFQFAYVLTSSEHGLITEFENFGSASGSFDLQTNVTQANLDGQSYVFNLTGASNSTGTVICNVQIGAPVAAPYDTIGIFTLDQSGNIASGVQDFNDNCNPSINAAVTGSVNLPAGSNYGTAKLTSAASICPGTTCSFDVFPIDSTHLKLIETDTQPILVGDAFTQSSSIPAGNNVFTMAGFDIQVGGPFTAAGIFDFDSNGNIKSDSVEDINDAGAAGEIGAVTGTSITGISTPLTGGRTEITFVTGFVNGNGGNACSSSCIFAAYPSTGGLQMLEIDNGGMTNGIAYPQTATTMASNDGFGMNLSGVTSNGAEDDIVEFTNNNGKWSGIIDVNDQGSTSFRNSFSSTYAADGAVSGRGVVTPSSNSGYALATYVIDSATSAVVSVDSSYVALGAVVQQNASAKSNLVANHLAVLRTTPAARMKLSRKKTGAVRFK